MSNRTYEPDAWVIVKIWNTAAADEAPVYKVLGGWYGGFAGSNTWRLSSGIESATKEGNVYTLPQFSGSTYKVHENNERMNMLMAGAYANFEQELEDAGGENAITVISIKELVKAL